MACSPGVAIRPFESQDCIRVARVAKSSFGLSYLYRAGFGSARKVKEYHVRWVKIYLSMRVPPVCSYLQGQGLWFLRGKI